MVPAVIETRMRTRPVLSLGALVLLGGCAPDAPSSSAHERACADGADDDRDGRIDCDDADCALECFAEHDAGTMSRRDAGAGSPGCADPLDVVFVIDVSTSMDDDVGAIRAGLDSIWTAASGLTESTQFSMVVFVDNALAVNGCAPFASIDAMQAEFERWRAFCETSQNPVGGGENFDCPENSLDALYLAATSCPWRAGATHVLIHVTDDTFVERPAVLSEDFETGEGTPVEHTYGEVMRALRDGMVRVGAFASPSPGEECGAGSSENAGEGFHDPFRGMPSIAEATGGRVWSIRDARGGGLDMAEAINAFTRDEHCTLF
jgi:hypothetical protein